MLDFFAQKKQVFDQPKIDENNNPLNTTARK